MPQGIAAPPFSILKMPVGGGQILRQTGICAGGGHAEPWSGAARTNWGRLQHAGSCFPAPCAFLGFLNAVTVYVHRKTGCGGIAGRPARWLFPSFSLPSLGGSSRSSTQMAGFVECGVLGSSRFPPSPTSRMREVVLSAAGIPRFESGILESDGPDLTLGKQREISPLMF
jgi:hypothetical protein